MKMQHVVIVGQGYVGLPLAEALAGSVTKISGVDLIPQTVEALNRGKSHIADVSDAALARMLQQGYSATTDIQVFNDADVIVICVPTPLDDGQRPDLGAVEAAARSIAEHLTPHTLVILESTTYPGTTDDLLVPILETSGLVHGEDFLVAFSPERVDPGSLRYGIKNTPKLVGGTTPRATKAAAVFYSEFVDSVIPLAGAREAETAKLLENTYRHVNIALVNEMAKFCHELGIDIWEVIRGARTKPFGFQAFYPGPGVGGHCIPIDPNYLGFEVRKKLGYPFRFVELAQEVNNSMPAYVVDRVADLLNSKKLALNGARILLLGVTYKANIPDERESPAVTIAERLLEKQSLVSFHDPFVPLWALPSGKLECVSDLDGAIASADIVVLLQAHSFYNMAELASKARAVLDTRGVAPEPAVRL